MPPGLEIERKFLVETVHSLWPLTEGQRISKRRYLLGAEGGARIELDVYAGALTGLVTAEVEFDSSAAAAAFSPPPWLGREVTDDPAYKNKRLAIDGLPEVIGPGPWR
jgi:adenylate cyclase